MTSQRKLPRAAALLLPALVAGAIAGCGSDSKSSGASTGGDSQPQLTYAWNQILAADAGSQAVGLGIQCYARHHGGSFITADANLDLQREVTNFTDLLTRGADVLIYLPIDPKAFIPLLADARDKGATAIELYNQGSKAPGSLWEDADAAGKLAADYIASKLPDGATVVTIGLPGVPGAEARIAGFERYARAAGLTVIDSVDSRMATLDEGRQLGDEILTKHPDVDVIFGFNESVAIGAGLAARAKGADVMTVGINATREAVGAIENGTLTASVEFDQFDMGEQAAALGTSIHGGGAGGSKPLEPKQMLDAKTAPSWVPPQRRCS